VAGDHGKAGALSEQHAAIAMIGAFTGSSDLPRLTTALGKGLDAGMGGDQVKEVLVQMYAHAGFPPQPQGHQPPEEGAGNTQPRRRLPEPVRRHPVARQDLPVISAGSLVRPGGECAAAP
jgi:hypothetical protein